MSMQKERMKRWAQRFVKCGVRHRARFATVPLLIPAAAGLRLAATAQDGAIGLFPKGTASLTAALGVLVLLLIVCVFYLIEKNRRRTAGNNVRQQEIRTGCDAQTGIYGKGKWTEATTAMLASHTRTRFVLVRMNLMRFRLVHTYLGERNQDALLYHIGLALRAFAASHAPCTFGRIENDAFVFCFPFQGRAETAEEAAQLLRDICEYDTRFDVRAAFGCYCIKDRDVPMAAMLARTTLAAASVREDGANYAFYTDDMGLAIEREQFLVDGMQHALDADRFRILIQPKFNLHTGAVSGGEALVRWHHEDVGVIGPGEFIPAFEKAGRINELDAAVWEQLCRQLRAWFDKGLDPLPVSVNVSRVNLYHPHIVETLTALLKKYDLPPRLVPLELTESAYQDDPIRMQRVIKALRENGFSVVLDDFGSGFSSLGILKDIEIDFLKIDLHAIAETRRPERIEGILASIVRMAKWLDLPVIAEGAESRKQAEFLERIGCDYAQGFFYSYPLEPNTYIALKPVSEKKREKSETFDINSLFAGNSQMEILFSDAPQAAGLYEYDDKKQTIDCLRVNRMFGEMFGYSDTLADNNPFVNAVLESKVTLLEAADAAAGSRGAAECEYLRRDGICDKWINLKLKYINSIDNRHILLGSFFDITAYKRMEIELFKYRSAVADIGKETKRMLVVDDQKIYRDILRKIFVPEFSVLDAASGEEALALLAPPDGDADIILLDMRMPGMGGEAFLKIKQADKRLEPIPVIIVTSEDSSEQQINMLALGAYDYIVKPLIPEVIRRRVANVLESSQRFRVMLREYQQAINLSKADPLTRVYNRAAAEEEIGKILAGDPGRKHAMVMIDIDDYKNVNDTYGHNCGDLVLMEFGNKLAHYFRAGDIVARMGGDEFGVLMVGVPSGEVALNKCLALCGSIRGHAIGDQMVRISCSAGIALSGEGISFGQLYERADEALYQAKHSGKGTAVLYNGAAGKEAE